MIVFGKMENHVIFAVSFLVFAKCIIFSKAEGPIVKTPLGAIRGTLKESYEGRIFSAFEGIPYAKPPVGELRFKEPQPPETWLGELYANKTYVCMQYTYLTMQIGAKGDEDCLYLYIYVPRENITGEEKLDVVVHIHGGAFIIGDPKSLAGPEYLMDRDLVYVSMNYRLGILGFLSTEDDVVPGNNGLKDQSLAMKWVKENIQYFGGNPDSITLTGMSAGAACVHFHYFSPLSKGLFHRAHSQSGTALNPWALTKSPLKNAQKLGDALGCNKEVSEELVNCLRTIPGRNLTAALVNFFVYSGILPSNAFVAVIEHSHPTAFLVDHPYKLLLQGKFNDYPWITSNAKDEGIIPVGFFVMFHKLPEFDKQWNEALQYTLGYYDTADEEDKTSIAKAVKEYYLNNESLSMENVLNFTQLHTDRLFLADTENAIRLHAKMGKSPVYYYLFDYLIHIPVIFKAKLPVVGHGDDFILIYRNRRDPKVLQDDDNEMRKILVDFIYNYATKGFPKFKDIEWKTVSANEEIDYVQVSSPNDIYAAHSRELGSSSFWNSLPLKENAHLFSHFKTSMNIENN